MLGMYTLSEYGVAWAHIFGWTLNERVLRNGLILLKKNNNKLCATRTKQNIIGTEHVVQPNPDLCFLIMLHRSHAQIHM